MKVSTLFQALTWAGLASQSLAMTIGSRTNQIVHPYKREPLQDIVTWDERSIYIRGERLTLFSGEFHPFRLPVPSLWLDVFQKLKSAGYSGVSFYVDWALLEGKPGDFNAEGALAWEPFFEAAKTAGIYLIARPGPYINAEVSGGGFPGWLGRDKAVGRTPEYIDLTKNYVKYIGEIIAKAQITNGGPVILFQPENEYTGALDWVRFPDPDYMQEVMDLFQDAGIVVPMISNDAYAGGHNAPGTGKGEVDIYGHDGYPLGFDCSNPEVWPDGNLPTDYFALHLNNSPTTPYTIPEYQGGAFDPWGGASFERCLALVNAQFQRVFYKNLYASEVSIFNQYMIYEGTNWGNLGHPGGYSSYDYGATIAENRGIAREKYSEMKLQGNFFKVSPAYLEAVPEAVPSNDSGSAYTNNDAIYATKLSSNSTNFYVVRHTQYNSLDTQTYKLNADTSQGTISIPQLNNSLTLYGRDSKVLVTDYDLGGINLLYSSAEVFTWKKNGNKTTLILYGAPGETHEAAFVGQTGSNTTTGSGPKVVARNGTSVVNWKVTEERKIVNFKSGLSVYLLSRYDAYNYWVIDLPEPEPVGNFQTFNRKSIIARAGHLIRTASIDGNTLSLTGDVNATTSLEIISGAPAGANVEWNSQPLSTSTDEYGHIVGEITFSEPEVEIPDLSTLTWKYIDNFPEVKSGYSDASWPTADVSQSNNTARNQTTPTSLYASDYGFNTGTLLSRGHFVAYGNESKLSITTQGGNAYSATVYLNETFLDSWPGTAAANNYTQNITLPRLKPGSSYVITVVNDHMGLDGNWVIGTDGHKGPRGILDYQLAGREASAVTWKLTGNFRGEDYADRVRGPLNEGGLFAERQGYHLPGAPTDDWEEKSPFDGVDGYGIGFFSTTFDLDVPEGYDVPMSLVFSNTTDAKYRALIYVNGWQFGRYVNNVGPQFSYPVPEGIFNYHGSNTLAVSLWSFDEAGNSLSGLELVADAKIATGFGPVELVPQNDWEEREGAY